VKRSNRLVILVGVLLAVLAFVGIVILLNSRPPGEQGPATTVTVTVAKEDIAIGDPVTPDLAETKEVALDAVEQTRIADPSLLLGRPALVPIPAQGQITMEKAGLVPGQQAPISTQLKPGEKAIAFQVDRVTGLDFLIQAGDHVDIVLTETLQVLQPTADTADSPANQRRFETITGLENAKTVKTILQDKRVLYVSATRIRNSAAASPSPGQEAQAPAAAEIIENVIIVFAGTDQDAEAIKFAQNDLGELGALTATLRSTQDTDVEKTTGITIDLLVKKYGIPIPSIITDLATNKRNR
jgi:pilus assembly protein CpaB